MTEKPVYDHKRIEEELVLFMGENAPKSGKHSKIDPVRHVVVKMHEDGYSHDQISGFMSKIGITVHSTTIGRYLKKLCKSDRENTPTHLKENGPLSLAKNNSSVSASLDSLQRPVEKKAAFTPFHKNQESSKK